MCGRFTLTSPPQAVRAAFGYPEQPNFPPRFNIAPTQPIAVVRSIGGERHFGLVRWGLIPSWVKDPKTFTLLINARAETMADKPAFRAAVRRRRCVVPADGWYEWQVLGPRQKRPYHIRRADGGVMAFAALWEDYLAPDGSQIETAAIVTRDALPHLGGIHDRMPAVLRPEAVDAWLDPANEAPPLRDLLTPPAAETFEAVPVSSRVGAVANDDPGLVVAAGAPVRVADSGPAERQLDLF